MDSVLKAMEFMAKLCEGDVDKNGVPYWTHPVAVYVKTKEMAGKFGLDESACVAAILHDVVEDGKTSFEEVEKRFGIKVCHVVRILTHEDGVPYQEYINDIIASGSKEAMVVKLADLLHNSDPDRLCQLPLSTINYLLKKYYPAIHAIKAALDWDNDLA